MSHRVSEVIYFVCIATPTARNDKFMSVIARLCRSNLQIIEFYYFGLLRFTRNDNFNYTYALKNKFAILNLVRTFFNFDNLLERNLHFVINK